MLLSESLFKLYILFTFSSHIIQEETEEETSDELRFRKAHKCGTKFSVNFNYINAIGGILPRKFSVNNGIEAIY